MIGGLSRGGVELSRILAGQKHAPVVYFARIGNYVKIGTTTNLTLRMRSFYLSLEDVLVVVPGAHDVEAAYHRRFTDSRHPDEDRRELFRIDGQLLHFLGTLRSAAKADTDPGSPGMVTLRQACVEEILRCSLEAARKASQRAGFPKAAGWDGPAALYSSVDLEEWQRERVRVPR
jgi:T5orf172 domain